jgi:hypothetical protein
LLLIDKAGFVVICLALATAASPLDASTINASIDGTGFDRMHFSSSACPW